MPPQHIIEATNPGQPEINGYSADSNLDRRGRLSGKLGVLLPRSAESQYPTVTDLDMNVAESYGIKWDAEKCGRDAFQNFFDANGGTLDGVRAYMEELPAESGKTDPTYAVSIEGDAAYDFRDLTVIGATTKATGEHTAGGFGEGAKFLALSLLRDHDADRVIYRSENWQLEFFIGDLPESKVARPTRGLFARVATGLKHVDGSSMVITSRNKQTIQSIFDTKQCFKSSENPDFQDNILEKTFPDGTQTGVKFMGIDSKRSFLSAKYGNLYLAGQRRHYSKWGDSSSSWATVEGLTVWTTKDVAPGDRDRGAVGQKVLKERILAPLAKSLEADEVRAFFKEIEPAYPNELSGYATDLGTLADLISSRGNQLGVRIDFEPKYVAVTQTLGETLQRVIEEAGYVMCSDYYKNVGMRTDVELFKILHEHQRIEPTPEQQTRIDLLQEALSIMTEAKALKKEVKPKEIWLYSKAVEENPFEGSYDEGLVWFSEEYLGKDFASAFAAYLHELDHESGDDDSEEFSYALTDTLAELIHAITSNPDLAGKFQGLAKRWHELGTKVPASDVPHNLQ